MTRIIQQIYFYFRMIHSNTIQARHEVDFSSSNPTWKRKRGMISLQLVETTQEPKANQNAEIWTSVPRATSSK